jgi:hypothetical protein
MVYVSSHHVIRVPSGKPKGYITLAQTLARLCQWWQTSAICASLMAAVSKGNNYFKQEEGKGTE